jgi:two-component system, cell cycle sensor histidine kinase and response regulator CckA
MKEHILIVEDSTTQREKLRMILESEGFAVTSAADGSKGLQAAGESKFDLIISDVMMPGLTGYDLCRKLKQDDALKTIPIILLTSLGDPMDVIRGLECGADNFIKKPYEPDVLVQRVRSVIENRKLQNQAKLKNSDELFFLGQRIDIQGDTQQVLNFLISTFEDTVQTNKLLMDSQHELTLANAKIEKHARYLEGKVFQTEQKYRFVFENAVDAIIVVNLDGFISGWNHGAEIMYGYHPNEMLGQPLINLVTEEHREGIQKIFDLVIGGTVVPNYESIRVKKDGTLFEVATTASAIRDDKGKIIGLSAISRDITERKKIEAAEKKYEEQMRLAQKMDAIGRLAGGVAHDFNNLLSVISGNVEFLLPMVGRENDQFEICRDIQAAVLQGARLTKQLLVFGQKQVSQPQSLYLNEINIEMNKMIKRLIDASVEFSIIPGKDLRPIHADLGQIQQVILNLAINARDAMPQGGKLVIETKNVSLEGPVENFKYGLPAGDYVRLTATDTGTGMSPEVRQRIFEPFFTTKEGKGTGLGLASVYTIVKKWGGAIFVESELGKGSVFTLLFPALEHEEPAEAAPITITRIPNGSETLLLAEDEELVRKVLVRSLIEKGYRVLQACDGEHALQVALEHEDDIDLLITDTVMPKKNGLELARELKKIRPNMKVMFMSGYTQEILSQKGILDPDINLIQKPFESDFLLREVRKTLDEKLTPAQG